MDAAALISNTDTLSAFGIVIEPGVSTEECAGERTIDGEKMTIIDIAFVPDGIDELAALEAEWAVVAAAIGRISVLERRATAAGGDINHDEILEKRAYDMAVESDHEVMDFEAIMFAAAGLRDGCATARIEATVEGLNGLPIVEDSAKLGQYPRMQEKIPVLAGDIETGGGVVSGQDRPGGHKLALVVGGGLNFL